MDSYANCAPWGNVLGMRIGGDLVEFETSMRLVEPGWKAFTQSSKYNWLDPVVFTAQGNTHHSAHALKNVPLHYTVDVEDVAPGLLKITITALAKSDIAAEGLFFCLELPNKAYLGGMVELCEATQAADPFCLGCQPGGKQGVELPEAHAGVRVKTSRMRLEIQSRPGSAVILRQDLVHHPACLNDPYPRLEIVDQDPRQADGDYQLYFPIHSGNLTAGLFVERTYLLRGTVEPDNRPAHLALDVTAPGRRFDGVSGNFRWQFPQYDRQVIDYCLEHLRVSWGRTAMWWRQWHPDEETDPTERARAGLLPEQSVRQMEIARELAKRNIPLIVSAWDPPQWAVAPGPMPDRGVRLDENKMDKIGASIAAYLKYLKQYFGVEAVMFSFNETDVGVEVRQTPEEHNLFTKRLGQYFASQGLATRMLLGDTGHGTAAANQLNQAAVADPETHKYVGAVAFHTWHGCTPTDLAAWVETARALNVPLMAIEGGPDSAAHRYPLVFTEPWFQLLEIDLYIRICAQGQVSTIMEWQFTSDYSILTGGGVYGTSGPLRPTQRFWNLKQLGTTPEGAFALPITCDRPEIHCAAFGHIARGEYALHLVNNGGACQAVIGGIPSPVREWKVYVTDAERGMEEVRSAPVVNGQVVVDLEPASFTSLFSVV